MNNIFFNLISNFNYGGENLLSSIFSSKLLVSLVTKVNKGSEILRAVHNFLLKIIYFIAKFLLFIVDFMFSYIRRLCGLNMDTSSLDSIFSSDSDVIFNFLYSSQKVSIPIFRSLLILAVVMIIVFTIIAIVKSQFESVKQGKPAVISDTIKKTLKAFVLLLITPLIAFAGIAFSDILLQSLYKATNTTNSISVGTQIFSASTTAGNAYRIYAENGKRIPIIFIGDDDNGKSNAENAVNYYIDNGNQLKAPYIDYIRDSKNLTFATYMSFYNNDFQDYTNINDILKDNVLQEVNAYYMTYDSDFENADGTDERYISFKRISSYSEEYYVMADVLDYVVNSSTVVYMKTMQEVLDKILDITDETLKEDTFYSVANKCQLKLFRDTKVVDGKVVPSDNYLIDAGDNSNPNIKKDLIKEYEKSVEDGGWKGLYYFSDYLSPDESGNPSTRMQISYTHLRDAKDEVEGAKYIIAVEKKFGELTYFEPLYNGFQGNNNAEFNSDYIRKGNLISAKGIFKDGVYPTAIRTLENGTIEFYRQDIEGATTNSLNGFINVKIGQKKNIFQKIVSFIKTITGRENVDVDLTVNEEDIKKIKYDVGEPFSLKIEKGEFRIGYFMSYDKTNTSYKMTVLFIPDKVDLLLLAAGPVLLIKMMFMAFFGLIQRVMELFLIILTYPVAVVTLPLDDRGYDTWWKTFLARLFLTYGMILGINFIFMLFPIIAKLEYFTQDEVGTNKLVGRVASLFFGNLTIRQFTTMLNLVTAILFELVAFTLLETVPKMINDLLGVGDVDGEGSVKKFMKVVSAVMAGIRKIEQGVITLLKSIPVLTAPLTGAGAVARGAKAISNKHKKDEFKRKLVPGSAIFDEHRSKNAVKLRKQQEKEKFDALNKVLENDVRKPGSPPTPPEGDEKTNPDGWKTYGEQKKAYEDELKAYQDQAKKVEQSFKDVTNAQKAELEAIKNPKAAVQQDEEAKWTSDLENMKNTGFDDVDKKSNKNDGEGGDDDSDDVEEEMSVSSKHRIKKMRKEAKKKEKLLKKWAKNGGNVSQEEINKLHHIQEVAKDELKNKDRKSILRPSVRKYKKQMKEQLENSQRQLSKMEVPTEPVKPTKPENATPEQEAEYQSALAEYNNQKKVYDERKKAYDEKQEEIDRLDLIVNRKQKIKEHKKDLKAERKLENAENLYNTTGGSLVGKAFRLARKGALKGQMAAQQSHLNSVLQKKFGDLSNATDDQLKEYINQPGLDAKDKARLKALLNLRQKTQSIAKIKEDQKMKKTQELFTDKKGSVFSKVGRAIHRGASSKLMSLNESRYTNDLKSTFKDIETASADDIKKYMSETKDPKTKAKLKALLSIKQRQDEIAKIQIEQSEKKQAAKEARIHNKSEAWKEKRRKWDASHNVFTFAGRKIGRKINSKNAENLEAQRQKLATLETDLKEQEEKLKNNPRDKELRKKIEKLRTEKAKLEAKIDENETWTQESNKEYRDSYRQENGMGLGTRIKNKFKGTDDKSLEKRAIHALEMAGLDLTTENINRVKQELLDSKNQKQIQRDRHRTQLFNDVSHSPVNWVKRGGYRFANGVASKFNQNAVSKFYQGTDFKDLSNEEIEARLTELEQNGTYNKSQLEKLRNYANSIIRGRDNEGVRNDALDRKRNNRHSRMYQTYGNIGQHTPVIVKPVQDARNLAQRAGITLKSGVKTVYYGSKVNSFYTADLTQKDTEFIKAEIQRISNSNLSEKKKRDFMNYASEVLAIKEAQQIRAQAKQDKQDEKEQKKKEEAEEKAKKKENK